MTAESTFSNALRTVGFIDAISRFGEGNGLKGKSPSVEDYVGRITAIFSPFLLNNIPEGKFIGIQTEVKKVVTEIKGQK